MLILTRKKTETIQIGGGISITVIRISGSKVRLGISAPRETRVLRVELEQQIPKEPPSPGSQSNLDAKSSGKDAAA